MKLEITLGHLGISESELRNEILNRITQNLLNSCKSGPGDDPDIFETQVKQHVIDNIGNKIIEALTALCDKQQTRIDTFQSLFSWSPSILSDEGVDDIDKFIARVVSIHEMYMENERIIYQCCHLLVGDAYLWEEELPKELKKQLQDRDDALEKAKAALKFGRPPIPPRVVSLYKYIKGHRLIRTKTDAALRAIKELKKKE